MMQAVRNEAVKAYLPQHAQGMSEAGQASRVMNSTARAEPQAESLKDCLKAVLGMRAGHDAPGGSRPISEQDMYGATAMNELSKLDPSLGGRLKAELPKMIEQMGTSKGEHLMLKAVDRIMRAMARRGEISQDEYRSVRDAAFGKSQFNGDRTEVSDHTSATPTSGRNAIGFEDAICKAQANRAASAEEIGAFRARGAEISRRKYLEKKANGTLGKNKAAKTAFAAAPFAADSAVAAEIPKGFLWKPQSDSDGKLAILLPPQMLYSTTGLRILSADGKSALAEGRFVGIFGTTGRRIYRFAKDGNSFPPGCKVEIQLATGERKLITVQNPRERLEKK